jgi:hypothetical protein
MEIFKNLWKREEIDKSKEIFPEDLKKIIIERQELKKRIKGLEMDMDLVASAKDQRDPSDAGLRKKLEVDDKKLAMEIFDLCGRYKIEPIRFLSPEEVDQFSSDDVGGKAA